MKTLSKIVAVTSLVGMASIASAQVINQGRTLLFAYDFNQFLLSGSTAVNISNVDNRTINSTLSDVASSSTLDFGNFAQPGGFQFSQNAAFASAGTLVNSQIASQDRRNPPPDGAFFGIDIDQPGSALGFASTAAVDVNGTSFSLSLDTTGFTALAMSFAGSVQSNGADVISWSYDAGTGPVVLSDTTITSDAFNTYNVDLSALDNLGNVTLIGTLSGATALSNRTAIDNLQVIGVPEPGTYAAIFGALALIGVAVRRRIRKA